MICKMIDEVSFTSGADLVYVRTGTYLLTLLILPMYIKKRMAFCYFLLIMLVKTTDTAILIGRWVMTNISNFKETKECSGKNGNLPLASTLGPVSVLGVFPECLYQLNPVIPQLSISKSQEKLPEI
ncbi:uncharacterized protein LOC130624136 [Hydractinia symbiolongicarpus]|uniref:uncharacterized protein LOC130624136 n=1 Tax=Hydractinia symbiolongicarpus TaxID=13093 RepID=UPI002549CAD8|nr:uncharacterized protein LOC130624136 [Hydractinia symbiolongicarpus]